MFCAIFSALFVKMLDDCEVYNEYHHNSKWRDEKMYTYIGNIGIHV